MATENLLLAVGTSDDERVEPMARTATDIAAVSGRKRLPAGKAVFGNTAQPVLLSAPCPVTFVRSGH